MDETELRQIVERHAPSVYRLAYARTSRHADAEDVMQEVFLRLVRTRPEFRDEEHCKAWLLRVAVNCVSDVFRAPWRRHEAPLENLPAEQKGETGERTMLEQVYRREMDGVTATDSGIQIRVLPALADETGGTVYFEATDLEGNRLDDRTTLNGEYIPCLSYDAQAKTALFARRIEPADRNGDGTLLFRFPRCGPVITSTWRCRSPGPGLMDFKRWNPSG